MTKYIIEWNVGCGDIYDEVEAEDEESALESAYDCWHEEAASNASYSVIGEASNELREAYGLSGDNKEGEIGED